MHHTISLTTEDVELLLYGLHLAHNAITPKFSDLSERITEQTGCKKNLDRCDTCHTTENVGNVAVSHRVLCLDCYERIVEEGE